MKLINSSAKGGSTIFKLKSTSMVQPESAILKNKPVHILDKYQRGQSTLEASVMKSIPNKGAAKHDKSPAYSRNG